MAVPELEESPEEILEKRQETSKTFDNKNGTHTISASIAPLHYKENYAKNEPWLDIDPAHKVETPEYTLYDKMPIKVKVFKNKIGYEVEDRGNNHKITVELDQEEPTGVAFEVKVYPTKVRLWKTLQEPSKLRWKVTEEGEGKLRFREKPDSLDANNNEVEVLTTKTPIANGFIWEEEITGKAYEKQTTLQVLQGVEKEETAIKYPIKVDTDVNKDVAASGDDGYWNAGGGLVSDGYLTAFWMFLGFWEKSFMRFIGITIPQGRTITKGDLKIYGVTGSPHGTIIFYGDDSNNPDAPTTAAEANAITPTSTTVNWLSSTGDKTIDIKTIIQELVNSYDYSNEAIQILAKPTQNGDMTVGFESYDYPTAPRLEITYEVGGVGITSDRNAKITGKETDSDDRDAKVTGKAAVDSDRSAKITGTITTQSDRDAKITGKISVTDDRDAKTTGKIATTNDRSAKITGQIVSTRDSKVTGKQTVTNNRSAKITGKVSTISDRDSKITGKATSYAERDAKVTGKVDATSDRDAKVTGQQATTDDRDSKITGKISTTDDRDAKVTGQIVSSRDAKITGKQITTSDRDSKITGKQSDLSDRDAKITGKNIGTSDRDAKITGQIVSSRDSKITGKQTTESDRDSKITGKIVTQNDRDAKITGKIITQSDRDAKITGKIETASERAAKTIGKATGSSDRDAKVTGKASISNDRSAKITGKQVDSDDRSAKILGQDIISSDRDGKITGKSTDSSERSAKITGKTGVDIGDERSAKLTGKAILSSDRSGKIRGVYTIGGDRSAKIAGSLGINSERLARIIGCGIWYTKDPQPFHSIEDKTFHTKESGAFHTQQSGAFQTSDPKPFSRDLNICN